MMIDLRNEQLISLAEACRVLPKRPSPSTLWRWRKKGVNGVRLACIRVGARWCTTKSALEEFLRRQTQRSLHVQIPLAERDPQTAQCLERAGLINGDAPVRSD